MMAADSHGQVHVFMLSASNVALLLVLLSSTLGFLINFTNYLCTQANTPLAASVVGCAAQCLDEAAAVSEARVADRLAARRTCLPPMPVF